MNNHLDISGSIEIREVDIAGVACIRQTFHCFALNSNFIQPSVCKYVLFVCFLCLPDCKYLLFPCVSDTLAGDFLSDS